MANDFLVFGGGAGANVLSQAAWAALAARTAGFSSGVAQSAQLNKAWRQSSIMSAVLAQFISDRTGLDVLDDGTIATILANLKASAAAVNGDATKTFSVAVATANTHAVNLAAGDARYAALAGLVSQVFSVAAPSASGHATPLGEFAALLAAQGYVKIPVIVAGVKRTLIIQWISAVPAGGGGVFTTLPIAFPNAVLTGFASWLNAGGTNGPAAGGIGNLALGSATLFNNSSFTQNQINGLVIGW